MNTQGCRKLFYGGVTGKNFRHHGLLTAKTKNWQKSTKAIPKKWNLPQKRNYAKPRIWSYLSINFRFSGRFSKPKKLATKICWPSALRKYFACKRFAVHSNPLVVTGICDPNKSQARHQHNTVYLKKIHLTNLTSLNVTKNIFQQHS